MKEFGVSPDFMTEEQLLVRQQSFNDYQSETLQRGGVPTVEGWRLENARRFTAGMNVAVELRRGRE